MVSMEIHRSKVAAQKLWRIFRLAFLMIKKGLISKRKLISELNLAFKKSRLLFRKPMSSLFVYHRTSELTSPRHGRDYEFSCSSNSPGPVFPRIASRLRKQYHFPCLASPLVLDSYCRSSSSSSSVIEEDQNAVVLLPCVRTPDQYDAFEAAPEWLSEEELEDEGGNPKVDDEAEEFIRRFYEQLRSQNRQQLLEY